MKKNLLLLAMMATFFFTEGITQATPEEMVLKYQDDPGKKMNFQGTLYENGEPVNGERKLTFSIDLEDGETWTEVHPTVQVVEGLYAIVLGAITPMPSDLFYTVNERVMTVTVGNTVLGTTILLAPFALADNENFNIGSFKLEVKSADDTVALKSEIYGLGIGKNANAIFASSRTDSTNTAIYTEARAIEGNTTFQTGIAAQVHNEGSGWSVPVWGTAYAHGGGVAYGLRGEVFGEGSSFSAAARGLNFMVPSQGGSRYGAFFDTKAGADITYTGTSYGIRGAATGSIRNIGIYGSASGADSTENWAGWFEGDTRIAGKLVADKVEFSLNTETAGDSIAFRSEIFGPGLGGGKDANAMLASARTDSTNTAIYTEARANQGNAAFQTGISAQVHNNGSGWSIPVWGSAYANGGGVAYGLRGEVFGEGSSFSAAARGLNFMVPSENGSRYGAFFDTKAGADITYTGTSYGTRGSATGSMRNIGIYGSASGADSTENWAGWFEGDTRIAGKLVADKVEFSLNTETAGDSIAFRSEIFGPGLGGGKDANAMLASARTDSTNTAIYTEARANQGNTAFQTGISAQVHNNGSGWSIPVWGTAYANGGGVAYGLRGDVYGEGSSFSVAARGLNFMVPSENGSRYGAFFDTRAGADITYTGTSYGIRGSATGSMRNIGIYGFASGADSTENWAGWFEGKTKINGELIANYQGTKPETHINPSGVRAYNGGKSQFELTGNEDGNGKTWGYLNLLGNESTNIQMGARNWEANNGTELPYLALIGSIKKTNDEGNEFEPWMVGTTVEQSASGIQTGHMRLGASVDNHAIRMYGAADFEGNGSNIRSHIALDGSSGSIHLWGDGSASFTRDINAANFNQTSDARLKKDVKTLTGGLWIVNKLRGVRYAWKDETKSQNKIGFLAQEVEEVLPELVTTMKDGFKAINYSEMTAILVEAVKELSQQIEDLKEENDSLKAELTNVEEIEDRLAVIEALLKTSQLGAKSNQKD